MKSLYLNHSEFVDKCKCVKRRKQNPNISCQSFLRPPPAPPAAFLRIKKFLVLICDRREREAR